MYNRELYNLLLKFCRYYEILNDLYRAKAYRNAAHSISAIPFKLNKTTINKLEKYLLDAKKEGLKLSIGESIYGKIIEWINTGKIAEIIKLEKATDHGKKFKALEELEAVPGIGPITARNLIKLKIYNINDLKKAVEAQKIKLTSAQALGLKYLGDLVKKLSRDNVEHLVSEVISIIHNITPNYKFVITGSYRRGKKLIGDVDLVIYSDDAKKPYNSNILFKIAQKMHIATSYVGTISLGESRFIFLYRDKNNIVRQIDIFNTHREDIIPYLLYSTGSWEHNEYIRGLCKVHGYKLNQYGLYKGAEKIPLRSEADLYSILGLEYVAPENRD